MHKKPWLKKILLGSILFFIIAILLIILDLPFPANYRLTTEGTNILKSFQHRCQNINYEGIDTPHVAGSGYLNFKQFDALTQKNYSNIYLFNVTFDHYDLSYYKGRSLKGYFGVKVNKEGGFKERHPHALPTLRKFVYAVRRIAYGLPLKAKAFEQLNYNEEQALLKRDYPQIHYYQLLAQNWLKDTAYMDALVKFFQTIPDDGLVYFHCFHGRGRTTTFMALYDIFKNYDKLPLEMIIDRQYCMGGENLFDIKKRSTGSWKEKGLEARKDLLVHFYDYMNEAYPNELWTGWIHQTGNYKKFNIIEYKK